MTVTALVYATFRIAAVLAVVSASKTVAHMQPYVNFVIAVEDDRGFRASGLTVRVETLEAAGEADIREGLAAVKVAFPRDYAGPIRMRVLDRGRKTIAILDSGRSILMREFHYAHKTGAYSGFNPNFGDPFEDGTEFLGADGAVRKSASSVRCFRLAWNPDKASAEEKATSASAEEVDRKNLLELEKSLNSLRQSALRQSRFISAQGGK